MTIRTAMTVFTDNYNYVITAAWLIVNAGGHLLISEMLTHEKMCLTICKIIAIYKIQRDSEEDRSLFRRKFCSFINRKDRKE